MIEMNGGTGDDSKEDGDEGREEETRSSSPLCLCNFSFSLFNDNYSMIIINISVLLRRNPLREIWPH